MKTNDPRSTMTGFRTHQSQIRVLMTCATLTISVAAVAQIAPGYREPTDLVDGAIMAVTSGCYLAAAGRPVPGINKPSGGLAGKGVTEQESAPVWVTQASNSPNRVRYSTLGTPEGDIWIGFDETTSRCSVIARPVDVSKFRSAAGDLLVKGSPEVKREMATDGSESIVKGTQGFGWKSRVSTPTTAPDVVLIETDFLRK